MTGGFTSLQILNRYTIADSELEVACERSGESCMYLS